MLLCSVTVRRALVVHYMCGNGAVPPRAGWGTPTTPRPIEARQYNIDAPRMVNRIT